MKSSTAPARTAPAQPPWSVIVFGQGRVVLDHPGAGSRIIPHVPAGLMADVGLLLDECAQRFAYQGHGTVIVEHCPLPYAAEKLDGITHRVQLEAMITNAAAAGWTTTKAALQYASGWVTFYKRPCAIVHLGILDGMDPGKTPLFPADGTFTPEDIANQLARYHELTGVPYRVNPGVSGLAMIRQHWQGRPVRLGKRLPELPAWRWHGEVPAITTPDDMVWERRPSKAEVTATGPFVHGFDLNLAHLAAASACSLGWEHPQATGTIDFDPARPGVWRIEMPPAGKLGVNMPPIINPGRVARDGTGWISTPGAVFLRQLGVPIVVHDSWTSPAIEGAAGRDGAPVYGRQILRPIAGRLRDALAKHGRPHGHPDECTCPRCRLRATLKLTYVEAFGMMLTETSGIYRPDWVWSFHDLNRYNLTRKIMALPKRPPIRVNKDAVYWLDDNSDPRVLGETLGYSPTRAFGKFKIDYSGMYGVWQAEQAAARRKLRARRGIGVATT